MARSWNMCDTSGLGDGSEGVGHGRKQNSAMFTKFRLDSEPTPPTPVRESSESSRISWSRSPTAHCLPPIQNKAMLHSERQSQLPHPEARWTPIDTSNQYEPSTRYSTPYQPTYTYNNQYHAPAPVMGLFQQGRPEFEPPSELEMMPPPPNRAASTVLQSIKNQSQSTPPLTGQRRSRAKSQSQAPRIHGRHLDARENLLLVETCNKNSLSYGIKDGLTEFWSKIEKDFQDIVRREIPYKSVRRRMAYLVEQRKKEIADWVTGDERREDNWTHAIDEWIETVELHDLEQENSHRENTILKTQKAIGNMRRENMMNIHSEKRSLEEFMHDLSEDEGDVSVEEVIEKKNPTADYRQSPPLSDNHPGDFREASLDSDSTPKPTKSHTQSTKRPRRQSSAQSSDREKRDGTSAPPPSKVNKRAQGRLKAAQKHQKALDDAERARKALNPKKPKRRREERVSDTDAPLSEMAKTFTSFVEYLKETASATRSAPPTTTMVTTAPTTNVTEELKVMKDMLLTVVKAVGGIENTKD